MRCGPQLSAAHRGSRRLLLLALAGRAGLWPKKEEEGGRLPVLQRAGPEGRPSGLEARQRESSPFLFIFQAFESFFK